MLFANLAEAVAEGRGKAQAEALRRAKTDTVARRLVDRDDLRRAPRSRCRPPQLRQGDRVVCEAGDIIPGDGDVIDGIASVDESAITGESRAGDPRERRRPQLGHRRHARCCRTASSSRSPRSRARASSTG